MQQLHVKNEEAIPMKLNHHSRDMEVLGYMRALSDELYQTFDLGERDVYLSLTMNLLNHHFEGRLVTPSSLVAQTEAPYATVMRKLKKMLDAGLIEQRPRTKSKKTFSLHPSPKLIHQWRQLTDRIDRLGTASFGGLEHDPENKDYYYGGSYMQAHTIPPLQVLPNPLRLTGGVRVLVHGDPTFMVMRNLKKQFEQALGTTIDQRAFSIDRLREEALKNAERQTSRYDLIAVDLPWVGEFAEKNVLLPLDDVLGATKLDAMDFHMAGWKAAHWRDKVYGVPTQTTPELLFYRKDMFARDGILPPQTTDELLQAAKHFHRPELGRSGIAWNAARGTALGHTVLMTYADFGASIVNMPKLAGGYETANLWRDDYQFEIDTDKGLEVAEFLLELLDYSPTDILSMSWYERVRPYAEGRVAMAYGYTLLAPYFELDPSSPAYDNTGYLPHPAGPQASPIAHVGGYLMGIPANLPLERIPAAAEALTLFTSAQAQKLYIQNGSRTNPRYSVAADSDVRRTSPIFEAIDGMAWRDELQFWPRPPIPDINAIVQICGEVFHDMLRGITKPKDALRLAQARADDILLTRRQKT